jgi:hypothetical protein
MIAQLPTSSIEFYREIELFLQHFFGRKAHDNHLCRVWHPLPLEKPERRHDATGWLGLLFADRPPFDRLPQRLATTLKA